MNGLYAADPTLQPVISTAGHPLHLHGYQPQTMLGGHVGSASAISVTATVWPLSQVITRSGELATEALYTDAFRRAVQAHFAVEQYVMAQQVGVNVALPSLRPVELMVVHQAADGWFDIHNGPFSGAQAHGVRALGATLSLLKAQAAEGGKSSSLWFAPWTVSRGIPPSPPGCMPSLTTRSVITTGAEGNVRTWNAHIARKPAHCPGIHGPAQKIECWSGRFSSACRSDIERCCSYASLKDSFSEKLPKPWIYRWKRPNPCTDEPSPPPTKSSLVTMRCSL
jgi:hypothetical protein